MNYLIEINMFYTWLETNQLSKSSISLWHALMNVNNRAGWLEEFTVTVPVLEIKTGFKKSEIFKARNQLQEYGLISWQPRGGNLCAIYKIHSFTDGIASIIRTQMGNHKPFIATENIPLSPNSGHKQELQEGIASTIKTQTVTIIQTKHNQTKPLPVAKAPDKKLPVKKSGKKKEKPALDFWQKIVDTFDNFYLAKTGEKYNYLAKDFACLSKLYGFLKKRAELRKTEWTEETSTGAFNYFLEAAYKKDNWIQQNFTIPTILNQFNQIITSNGQPDKATGAKPGGKIADELLNQAFTKFYTQG